MQENKHPVMPLDDEAAGIPIEEFQKAMPNLNSEAPADLKTGRPGELTANMADYPEERLIPHPLDLQISRMSLEELGWRVKKQSMDRVTHYSNSNLYLQHNESTDLVIISIPGVGCLFNGVCKTRRFFEQLIQSFSIHIK